MGCARPVSSRGLSLTTRAGMLAEPSPSGDGAGGIEPALTGERRATPYTAGTDDVRGSAPLGGVGEQGGDLLGDVRRQ